MSFGYHYKVDLQKGFPLLTTKKVFFNSVVHELLWYLSGDTHIRNLRKNTKIWDAWTSEEKDWHIGKMYGYQWVNWEKYTKGSNLDEYKVEYINQIQNVIERFITQYFPDADIGVSRRWAGIQAMTPDGLAIVGNLPDEQEVYFAVGFSGHGNSMGLIAGERVVELMLNGRAPGVFSIQRFE